MALAGSRGYRGRKIERKYKKPILRNSIKIGRLFFWGGGHRITQEEINWSVHEKEMYCMLDYKTWHSLIKIWYTHTHTNAKCNICHSECTPAGIVACPFMALILFGDCTSGTASQIRCCCTNTWCWTHRIHPKYQVNLVWVTNTRALRATLKWLPQIHSSCDAPPDFVGCCAH